MMKLLISKYCSITPAQFSINNDKVFDNAERQTYKKYIRGIYKYLQLDYPKFFKMDGLSKLGFLSVELLLVGEEILKRHTAEKTGIILTNASSSLEIDEKHQATISDRNLYFPSPSNFVYTLPNIMAGETAIRHKIKGENTTIITNGFDPLVIHEITSLAFETGVITCCICGWVEKYGEQYESLLFLIEREEDKISGEGIIFEPSSILNIYKQVI